MAALRKRRGTDANVNQENAEMEQAEFDFGSSEETVNEQINQENQENFQTENQNESSDENQSENQVSSPSEESEISENSNESGDETEKNEENNDTVYIGEAERMFSRLKQHLKDSEYWNDCIAVISKDNLLNKAHVKYLENKFFLLAQNAGRAVVINNTVPTCSSISEYDEAMLPSFRKC